MITSTITSKTENEESIVFDEIKSRNFKDLEILKKLYPEIKNSIELYVINAIEPEIANGPWICGGAALQWYLGKECKTDIDVWCRNKRQEKKVESNLITLGFRLVFKTDNALTFRAEFNFKNFDPLTSLTLNKTSKTITVQLIKTNNLIKPNNPKSSKEIFKNFDFTICQIATDGTIYIVGENTYKDIKEKKLRLIEYKPKTFLKRYIKYVIYGYTPEPETIIVGFEKHKLNTKFKLNHDYDF